MVLTMICVFGIYFILQSYLTEIIGKILYISMKRQGEGVKEFINH